MAVGFLELGDKVLGLFISSVCRERCQQHQAFRQRSIEVLDFQDTVHTVAAEECGLVADIITLGQNGSSCLIVDGKENEVSARFFRFLDLSGQVGRGLSGERLLLHNVQSQFRGLGFKCSLDAG